MSTSAPNPSGLPTIFDLCDPRDDIRQGKFAESDFAADLAQVINDQGPEDYRKPALFFARTYPTRGLRNLLHNVCSRLTGAGKDVASIFRLDTSYGGGKTHGLIALVHAARGMVGVENPGEFLDPALIPATPVRVAAFDGENADPSNGRRMKDGPLVYTPWGEIAWALGDKQGYERVRRSDEERVAPGAETLRELFGDQPALILIDELSVYLRKVAHTPRGRDQLTAFLTALFKAVESSPRVALVYTLAIGKDGTAQDAYSQENQFIAERMAEAESVAARKSTLLNPTEDDETAQVLRRRLFRRIDDEKAAAVIEAYRIQWAAHRDDLSAEARSIEVAEAFRTCYPLHPDVLETFTTKTATLSNFQRVRGMLRLLAQTIRHVWDHPPADAMAIHLHHIDPGDEAIRQEFVTKLQQSNFAPAIRGDIAVHETGKKALAQEIDATSYHGLPPYATWVARTIFVHSLAFNDRLKGLAPDHLRYSILSPRSDISFIEDARKRFMAASAYLDDRPGVPMRFLAEANLTQILRRHEQQVDPVEARNQLAFNIRSVFLNGQFELIAFPSGPGDVPDEVGSGKPLLVLLSYDAESVDASVNFIPDLIKRIYERRGSEEKNLRTFKNNLVFVVADAARKETMRAQTARMLALQDLNTPGRLKELAEHQQQKIREWAGKSLQDVAQAIQQCYRHVFYPSRDSIEAGITLAHTALEIHQHENPGWAQRGIVRTLREIQKLRLEEDEPDSPVYLRDKTPLRKGQMRLDALREEFRRDPSLPILTGDRPLRRCIEAGVQQGEFVYQRGELLYGPGDPGSMIIVDGDSIVSTMSYAVEHRIWPRPKPTPAEPPPPDGGGEKPAGPETETQPPPPAPGDFSEEGILREALIRLWERMRAAKLANVHSLSIRPTEYQDAFRLVSSINSLPNAEKRVALTVDAETSQGSSLRLEFNGGLSEALPVREFLEPQLQDARERYVDVTFELSFTGGMSLASEAPEQLIERMGRYSSGSAYVKATAVAQ